MLEINIQFGTKTLFFHKSLQKHKYPCLIYLSFFLSSCIISEEIYADQENKIF